MSASEQQESRRAEAVRIAQRVLSEETDPEEPFVLLSQEFLAAAGLPVPPLGALRRP